MARIRFARIRGLIILNLEVGGINENDSNFLPVALVVCHNYLDS